ATAGQDKVIHLWDMAKSFDYQAPLVLSKILSSEAVHSTQDKFSTELDLAHNAIEKNTPLIAATHVRNARKLPGFANAAEAMDIWRKLYAKLNQNKLASIWEQRVFSGHEGNIHSVFTDMQGMLALSGGDDTSVKLWDIETGQCKQTFSGHDDAVRAVALSDCGHYAISASDDKTLKLWNIESSSCLQTFKGHQASVTCLIPTPNSRYLISGSRDKTLKLWDLQSGRILRTYNGHRLAVTSCWVTPDGQYVLSGSEDKTIRLWDIASGDSLITLGTFKGHIAPITSVCGSYDGRYALSASEDGDIRVWNIQRDQCTRILKGHEGAVTSIAISIDNQFVLSGGLDGNIRLWDLRNGECLQSLPAKAQQIYTVAMSMNKGFALSAGTDGNMRLWALDWELEDTQGHWDKGTITYLEAFIKQHTPQSLTLSYKTDLSVAGDGKSQAHTGLPTWGKSDLEKLYYLLGCAGYHKVTPDQVRSELQTLILKLKEDKEKETDITARRTLADFAQEKAAKSSEIPRKKASSIQWGKHFKTLAISIIFILVMLALYNFYTQSVEETELQLAKTLVKQGDDINRAGEGGQTMLHLAAKKGQLIVADFLIENDAHINKRDAIHWTPLHHAVKANQAEMVKLLIARGANPNLVAGPERTTPLMLARDNENEEITGILQDAINK
ncbi:MAG: hypothetical protein EP297_14945, partial [Gammaproteobacteria bacterium]